MPSHRVNRATEDIRRELTDIFRSMKDPRVQKMISIVRVDLTNDFSFAKVYVSAMEGLEAAKEACKGLESGSGFVRREISERLSLRHSPKFIFLPTDSIEYSAEISKKINDLKGKKSNEEDHTR